MLLAEKKPKKRRTLSIALIAFALTLLALLIYVAYLVLRAFGGDGEAEKKFVWGEGDDDVSIIEELARWDQEGEYPAAAMAKLAELAFD